MKYDIIIIGGGPAGVTAAIYALRANKKILLLEKEVVGGKIVTTPLVENYPGIPDINGADLSQNLFQQVQDLGGEIQMQKVISIAEKDGIKQVITEKQMYEADALIIATGTKYKTLGIEKEEDFLGKGISFCATCDGFFYKNKIVAVVGGGNTAVSNSIELAEICQKVYLLQRLDHLTAEPILIQRLQEKSNVEILYQTVVEKIMGEDKLQGIEVTIQGEKKELIIDGLFLSIGQIPETGLVEENIEKNEKQYIQVNKDYMTNQNGIFAAGDCIDKKVRQLTTAVNDGTIAALNAIEYIDHLQKE